MGLSQHFHLYHSVLFSVAKIRDVPSFTDIRQAVFSSCACDCACDFVLQCHASSLISSFLFYYDKKQSQPPFRTFRFYVYGPSYFITLLAHVSTLLGNSSASPALQYVLRDSDSA